MKKKHFTKQSATPTIYTANFSPPEEAVSIWLDNKNNIQIGIKKSSGIGYANSISISDPEQLGKFLFRLLTERKRFPRATIGEHGSPTRAMLEALAKTSVPIRKVEITEIDLALEASILEFSALAQVSDEE